MHFLRKNKRNAPIKINLYDFLKYEKKNEICRVNCELVKVLLNEREIL